MFINWVDLAGMLVIAWVAYDRIKKLEGEVRRLELLTNTQEMNLKKLYYFRQIELHAPNTALSAEERQGFKDELAAELEQLAGRNKYLLSQ